jgi:lysophospholipase L1-like esterase
MRIGIAETHLLILRLTRAAQRQCRMPKLFRVITARGDPAARACGMREESMVRSVLAVALCALVSVPVLHAQIAGEYQLPRPANCCLLNTATTLAEQLQDWNQLGRYHEANRELMRRPAEQGRVVFFGDSITDGWALDGSFPGKPYVNRGIGGQTTAQMLVRLYPDVIALKPAAVTLLAGTNDIARNNGPQTLEMIQHNIMAMTELAQSHGIKVILSALLPISDRTMIPAGGRGGGPTPRPRIQSTARPPADILRFNAWLKGYATEKGAVYADYYTATASPEGFLRDGYTNDGLHPNAQGYELMAPVASAAIAQALR